MNFIKKAGLFILMAGVSGLSYAGEHEHQHHSLSVKPQSDYVKEYAEINDAMHKGMSFESTGNPDEDFVRGMIAHHKGALEMAKVQLKYGKDQELIQLSKDIISAQKEEIAFMEMWLETQRIINKK